MVKLSIIIPAYNEGKNIYFNLNKIVSSINKVTKDFEIIFVNDGSKDDTLKEISRIKDKRLKIKSYEKNQGKGYALKYGFNFVKGKYVTFMDADLDINPISLKNFNLFFSVSRDHANYFHRNFISGCNWEIVCISG